MILNFILKKKGASNILKVLAQKENIYSHFTLELCLLVSMWFWQWDPVYTHVNLHFESLSQLMWDVCERVSLLHGNSIGVVLQNTVQMIIVSLEPSLLLHCRLLPLWDWCLYSSSQDTHVWEWMTSWLMMNFTSQRYWMLHSDWWETVSNTVCYCLYTNN